MREAASGAVSLAEGLGEAARVVAKEAAARAAGVKAAGVTEAEMEEARGAATEGGATEVAVRAAAATAVWMGVVERAAETAQRKIRHPHLRWSQSCVPRETCSQVWCTCST